ncbi:MAG: TrmH family RNA methyltransferase [Terriglobales bacterium]
MAGADLVKQFRQAFAARAPQAGGERLLALEGPRLIAEALRAGARLEAVLFSAAGDARFAAALRPQLSKHCRVETVGDREFCAAMDAEHPQGVAALARWRQRSAEDLFAAPPAGPPLLLAAAGLQDPGNLGTLIRAADAFGADGVAVLAGSVSPFHPKVLRAAAGSHFHLPVAADAAVGEWIGLCQRHGVVLAAAAAHGKIHAPEADLSGGLCLVIGQEASGVPRALQRAAQLTLAIPMARPVDSLNAGIAGAILLYEARRQRAAAPRGERDGDAVS